MAGREGAGVSRRKLTEEQVQQIRADRERGLTQGQLALKYGVTQQSISEIVNGLSYKKTQAQA